MTKLFSLSLIIGLLTIVYSCDGSEPKETESTVTTSDETETVNDNSEETQSPDEVEDAPQSVEDRIIEIKDFYSKIQGMAGKSKDCASNTKMSYDGMEGGYPFENKAKECNLENDFMYQQVELNGYEWSEKTSFYYKDGLRFFTFVSGGAEACGYDYRVYYDRDGEVIRVLTAENDCDGNDVPSSTEVTDSKKKAAILETVENAEKELKDILKE